MRKTLTVLAAAAATIALAAPALASHRYVPAQLRPHHTLAATWNPGDLDPIYVHDQPSQNQGGGSWAWADYGLYQVLRATRPSPAAKEICLLGIGDYIAVSGGMMIPGEWVVVSVTPFSRQPGDVDMFVDDPDGTHGGNCAVVGGVLRHVG